MAIDRKSDESVAADTMMSLVKAQKCYGYSFLAALILVFSVMFYSVEHPPIPEIKIAAIAIGSAICIIMVWSGILLAIRYFKLASLFTLSKIGNIASICARYQGVACWCIITGKNEETREVFLSPEQQHHLCLAVKHHSRTRHNVVLTSANNTP